MFGGSRRKGAGGLERGEGGGALGGGGGEMGGNLLPPGSASSANAAQVNRRIAAALQDNPDEVKRLFRTWVQQQGAA